jgi:hypothetical protein
MRPDSDTPIDVVILTLKAIAPWLTNHSALLDIYLPTTLDEPDEVLAIAHALELTHNDYTREQREDVALTNARAKAIADAQRVIRSVQTIAAQRIEAGGLDRSTIKDFSTTSPSRLLYIPTLRKSLRRSRLATTTHQAILDADGKQRSVHILQQIDQTLADLDRVSEDEVREEQETRAARRAFERAHEDAMGALDELHNAALGAQLDSSAPLDDLTALYEKSYHKAAPKPGDPST